MSCRVWPSRYYLCILEHLVQTLITLPQRWTVQFPRRSSPESTLSLLVCFKAEKACRQSTHMSRSTSFHVQRQVWLVLGGSWVMSWRYHRTWWCVAPSPRNEHGHLTYAACNTTSTSDQVRSDCKNKHEYIQVQPKYYIVSNISK